MATVDILITGYTSADSPQDDEERTCPTITLIQDVNLKMIVDPGVLRNQQELLDRLAEQGLHQEDIQLVGLTHSHIDHYRNLGLFPKAKVLEYYGIWDKDMVEDWPEQLTENIKIIKTPGHSLESITFLVTTEAGQVAICGDVFWEENGPGDDPYASDKIELARSRQKVLEIADWIIPGHGPQYRVKGN